MATDSSRCTYDLGMCRNIRPLHNFDPPATHDEVYSAALQYVRKISGCTKPSQVNAEAFQRAVDAVADVSMRLLHELVTSAPPKDRKVEAAKARKRAANRRAYGTGSQEDIAANGVHPSIESTAIATNTNVR